MRIRLSNLLLVSVTSLFCMLAFSSTPPNSGQNLSNGSSGESGVVFHSTVQISNPGAFDVVAGRESVTQKLLLLADNTDTTTSDKTEHETQDVCHLTSVVNGKYVDETLDYDAAMKKIQQDPDRWFLGTCAACISCS